MASADGGKPARMFEDRFFGTATVGERGQIVIPSEARKRYGIETGDKLLIMGTPDDKGLMVCKIDAVRDFMTMMLASIERLERLHHDGESEDHRIDA